jgi:hypothetical protein
MRRRLGMLRVRGNRQERLSPACLSGFAFSCACLSDCWCWWFQVCNPVHSWVVQVMYGRKATRGHAIDVSCYHVWLMRRYFQIPGTRRSTDYLLRPQSGSPLGVGAHDRVGGGNRI